MWTCSDLLAANRNQILSSANHAACCAAHLHMGKRSYRLQLEHEVEGRDLKHPNVRHVEHLAHMLDRGFTQPAFLLLRPPQKRDNSAGLTTFWIFLDLRCSPGIIRLCKGKALGLFGMKTA